VCYLIMIELLKEDYSKEEIEKYLSDWDNLEDTGWFNNPNKNIAEYTFHHKKCDDLKQFLAKGREIIRQRLMDKKRT
jgi:DNA-binding transcriptional MerR regulator